MSVHFFDCIDNPRNKFFNLVEDYFYLDGISEKLSFRRVCAISKRDDHRTIFYSSLPRWQQIARTISKIVSYFLFPPLPLLALSIKAVYRKTDFFKVSLRSFAFIEIKTVIPAFCDIRGKAWVWPDHLHNYSRYLKTSHPSLVIGESYNYVIDDIPHYHPNIGKQILKNCFNNENKRCEARNIAYPLFISGNHWGLIFIDREKRTIEFYDSKKNYGNHQDIVRYFQDFAVILTEKDPGKRAYQFMPKISKYLQEDSYECGIWTLYFLEQRLKNPEVNFNDLDVVKAKKMIADFRIHVMQKILFQYYNSDVTSP